MRARECFNIKFFTSNVLERVVAYHENNTDQEDLDYCKSAASKDECYRNQRLDRLEEAFSTAQKNAREENAHQRMPGAAHAPLLICCLQFGSLTTAHAPASH